MQRDDKAQQNEEVQLQAQRQLAEAIRQACLQAALAGYEDASMSGLCHEGAWEMAIDSIRSLDINALLEQMSQNLKGNSSWDSE